MVKGDMPSGNLQCRTAANWHSSVSIKAEHLCLLKLCGSLQEQSRVYIAIYSCIVMHCTKSLLLFRACIWSFFVQDTLQTHLDIACEPHFKVYPVAFASWWQSHLLDWDRGHPKGEHRATMCDLCSNVNGCFSGDWIYMKSTWNLLLILNISKCTTLMGLTSFPLHPHGSRPEMCMPRDIILGRLVQTVCNDL